MNEQTILSVISVLLGGGFVGSIVRAMRARPERDAIVIVPWKTLNESLQKDNESLRLDRDRERTARIEADRRIEELEERIDRLEDQIRKGGRRPAR